MEGIKNGIYKTWTNVRCQDMIINETERIVNEGRLLFSVTSVHLWTVPLSFTLFMVTTSTKRQDLLDHFKLIMRLKILPHQRLSLQEPRKSITYSLINSVLLLKTPGGSSSIWLLPNSLGKDIPWFQLKVLLFKNCCYRRFFYFILSVGLTVYLCRASIKHTLMLIRRF